MTCSSADREAIADVINRYAYALDERDWALLEDVFAADAVGRYGSADSLPLTGREAIVTSISGLLDICGPTQHLLGNHVIRVEGDSARATCKARVFHYGGGPRAELVPYEVFGVYRDRLRRDPVGWRITDRVLDVQLTLGDPRILRPETP